MHHSPTSLAIFSATVYGAAEFVAEELTRALSASAYSVAFNPRPTLQNVTNTQADIALFCVSTTGQGQLPRIMARIADELEATAANLETLNYRVIALGDKSYGEVDFCGGGRRLDALLDTLGATRLAAPLLIDTEATNNPEEIAVPEILNWLQALREAAETPAQ